MVARFQYGGRFRVVHKPQGQLAEAPYRDLRLYGTGADFKQRLLRL